MIKKSFDQKKKKSENQRWKKKEFDLFYNSREKKLLKRNVYFNKIISSTFISFFLFIFLNENLTIDSIIVQHLVRTRKIFQGSGIDSFDPVNPDNCRRQGNLLIDRARQPLSVFEEEYEWYFFCRLPVKRLKPRGRSLRFKAIILSGKGKLTSDACIREEKK